MTTYSITVSRFGHRNLIRHVGEHGERIAGPKAWGGGTTVETFRSRSDKAAIKRFEAKTPEPKWRPWKMKEMPKYFMVQHKNDGHSHVRIFVRDVANSNGNCTFAGSDFDTPGLLENWLHLHEDGTTTPCGVPVKPRKKSRG